MTITADMVKVLRERSGAGMMECKKALTEANGDMDKAVTILRERGIAKAASKAARETREGLIGHYVHPGDKLAVLVEVQCETDFVARTDNFKELVKNIAMHIAASNPLVVRREDISQDVYDREREIYRHQTLNEGKPEKIVDKIVDGRMEKWYSEVALLEQPFVRDPEISVGDLVKNAIAKIGENIVVRRFVRYRLGE
ncbi:MAG: translation elongation factor Ts [candidate division Zixibacteria bacterium]|nr:translation elongation factor Ts [candidate division Zixibacteria bacterium]